MTRLAFALMCTAALLAAMAWAQDPFLEPSSTVDYQTSTVGAAPAPPPQQVTPPVLGELAQFPAGYQPGFNVAPAFAAAPQPTAPAVPMVPRINVVKGRWVRDAVTGALLDAPELTTDLESNKVNYSNNGETLGDTIANDEIWSNVESVDAQFIGPETQAYILYYINMLRLLHTMDPLSFSSVAVASADPVSPLPHLEDFQVHQDNKIKEWNERFLHNFREPDPITGQVSARGEFYDIYVPAPPFIQPIRPDPTAAVPPVDFVQQAWIAFQGGTPDPNQVNSMRGQAQGQPGYVLGVEPGVGGAAGAAGYTGGSYFGEVQGQSGPQLTPENSNPQFR
jgi:hypothetical protein